MMKELLNLESALVSEHVESEHVDKTLTAQSPQTYSDKKGMNWKGILGSSEYFNRYKSVGNCYGLQGLSTRVVLKPDECIRDFGYVDSILEGTRAFLKEMGHPHDDKYIFDELKVHDVWKDPEIPGGTCYLFNFENGSNMAVIMYTPGDRFHNVYLRGHEETHALQFFGRLDRVEDLVEETTGKSVAMGSLDGEVIGEIGGLLSLIRWNMRIPNSSEGYSLKHNPDHRDFTRKAYDILFS
jgi:hypothetical protein